MNKSNYLAFIPAKGNSSELKNKNIKKIHNKTLVDITIDEVKRLKYSIKFYYLVMTIKF